MFHGVWYTQRYVCLLRFFVADLLVGQHDLQPEEPQNQVPFLFCKWGSMVGGDSHVLCGNIRWRISCSRMFVHRSYYCCLMCWHETCPCSSYLITVSKIFAKAARVRSTRGASKWAHCSCDVACFRPSACSIRGGRFCSAWAFWAGCRWPALDDEGQLRSVCSACGCCWAAGAAGLRAHKQRLGTGRGSCWGKTVWSIYGVCRWWEGLKSSHGSPSRKPSNMVIKMLGCGLLVWLQLSLRLPKYGLHFSCDKGAQRQISRQIPSLWSLGFIFPWQFVLGIRLSVI